MTDARIRIFSYLPNPRVWKSLIAAELCGVNVAVVGDKPANLATWLWDFDARQLEDSERTDDSPWARRSRRGFSGTLYKTDAFLTAHPYGTVPAAFSPDGEIGIFESNSILRATVRASTEDHGLYGTNGFEASRIDSFLDASLVFAREAQVYLLGLDVMTDETWSRMSAAYEFYLNGIEQALGNHSHVAMDAMTIADIAFVCDVGQFLRERRMLAAIENPSHKPVSEGLAEQFPRVLAHMKALGETEAFSKHFGSFLKDIS